MLLQRTLTAMVLAPLAILIILLSSSVVFAMIVSLAFLAALWEWAQLSGLKSPSWRAGLLVVAACVFGLLWWARATAVTPLLLAAGVAWWLLACLWLRHFAFAAAPTRENLALKLLAGAFVIFPTWVALIAIHAHQPNGPWWTLLALLIVWASDIGAYFSGRTFGKRKLAPQISPGKTWAGAYGAMVAGVVVAEVGGWLLDVRGAPLFALALLAVLTVSVSIVGDLTESLMKRHAQVKDSGTIFPGHGGLMDRLDSVFAALPVFAAGMLLLDL
ncbi:CDP-archaeol synthase [Rhodanobacter glycinis]|uniref:Phosphatidate cytidylyltransferase n=1 Tax=Rhodanobacter glycinis TaxID=582702 RepID=A0A502CBF1_9GAMM|nr:CDP-archaeol synthase [Rhodanobacter glycinis]TPG10507.1 CDP-archaeol synthase [Rhodanobacter glycinis]TPG51287.1 CDP-archaeol synthase [Rhodanobacter glycinis]